MHHRSIRGFRSRWHHLTAVARRLRLDSTTAEREVWELVRNRRMLGLKFRRQEVLGGFIVDFYCHGLRLVLEIDGAVHSRPQRIDSDIERDAILRGLGYHVIHIGNTEISRETLREEISRILSPSPESGEGAGG